MWPLAGRAKRAATLAAVRRAICSRGRWGVRVRRIERGDWTPGMPPQTEKKSGDCFMERGEGEWSEPMVSKSPARTCAQSAAAWAGERRGGEHLAMGPRRKRSDSVRAR